MTSFRYFLEEWPDELACISHFFGHVIFSRVKIKSPRKPSRCISRAWVGHSLSRLHQKQKFNILHIKTLPTMQVSPQWDLVWGSYAFPKYTYALENNRSEWIECPLPFPTNVELVMCTKFTEQRERSKILTLIRIWWV